MAAAAVFEPLEQSNAADDRVATESGQASGRAKDEAEASPTTVVLSDGAELELAAVASEAYLHPSAEAGHSPHRRWGGFRRWLSVCGPGLVVMLADTDAGCLVTAAQTGSTWGYSMIWLQVVLIGALYMAQELTARFAFLRLLPSFLSEFQTLQQIMRLTE